MPHPIENVLILGRGALGVMYADFFSTRLPDDKLAFLVDKARLARYQKETLTCNGCAVSFEYRLPERAAQTDLLIVAVKGPQLREAIKEAKPAIGKDTIIVSVMNGISSEEIIRDELGEGCGLIIDCIAQKMDALFLDGQLTCGCFGELCIGVPRKAVDREARLEALARLTAFFDRIGFPYVLEDDITHRMWCKWMLNVAVNQCLMIHDGVFADIHRPGAMREEMIGAMREVMALSDVEGAGLTEEDFKTYLKIIDGLNPAGMPSMRQDRIARRPSEVALFAGTVIAKARSHGLEVPINEKFAQEVAKIEAAYQPIRARA